MTPSPATTAARLTAPRLSTGAVLALASGALILTLAMGIRQTFGLFMGPVCLALDIGREQFGLAMAVQNILWGAAQPFAGALADRFGALKVLLAGTFAYTGGLVLMASAGTYAMFQTGAGLLVGLGLSSVSFAVVLGAIGRAVPPQRRSAAFGLASAGGSFGQFAMAPVGQAMIAALGWSQAFLVMAGFALAMAPLALLLVRASSAGANAEAAPDSFRPTSSPLAEGGLQAALREASRHPGFWYLNAGFFVCGFQVVFIAVHLPSYLADLGLTPDLAAMALALIGFFNIIGTWGCGLLGGHYSKKRLLFALYAVRALTIAVFLAVPKTETTVLAFAAAIGLLWLGTVPLTSGLVGQIFGVRYLSTLFGLVFFSHQVGSFLGVWLGGVVYTWTGSYDAIWLASIVLGVAAAILHLPIREQALRPALA
ncbi:MFS transporter [uncultured Defluviicoccus sp.]|uniref:MFS transporter n=1 Tax=metagenome TaxID=256318 RepID=A0A380TBN0_9ZZZZ|nr:MFS transporter [uncultured Defluviicoccus sp.]